MIDLYDVARFRDRLSQLDLVPDLMQALASEFEMATPRRPDVLKTLLSGADGLIPRARLRAAARLYVRPGWTPAKPPNEPALTVDQQSALAAARNLLENSTHDVLVVSGPAGTGKTSVIREFVGIAISLGFTPVLLAPTGQAARRLERIARYPASTIHTALYEFARSEPRGDDLPPTPCFSRRGSLLANTVFIVDEASLVGDRTPEGLAGSADVRFGDGSLLSDVLTFSLRSGNRLILIGDPEQLAPIGERSAPAFDLEGLKRRGHRPASVVLNSVVRQDEGSAIAALAASLRLTSIEGRRTLPPIDHTPERGLSDLRRQTVPTWMLDALLSGDAVALSWRNADVSQWIRKVRRHAGRADGSPQPGDRLVSIRTDQRTGVVNGEDLIVLEQAGEPRTVTLRDQSLTLVPLALGMPAAEGVQPAISTLVVEDLLESATQMQQRRATQILWVDFLIRMRQEGVTPGSQEFTDRYLDDENANSLRCMYSYGRTVYRSQGGEWARALVDLSGIRSLGTDAPRLAYTAVSRARKGLWVWSWPSAARSVPPDALAQGAIDSLQHLVEAPLSWKPLNQPGVAVQITAHGSGVDVSINVYAKSGIPSRTVVQRCIPASNRLPVELALEKWLDQEQRAYSEPVDEAVLEQLREVVLILNNEGYDVEIRRFADYQVEICVDADGQVAKLRWSHNSSGRRSVFKGGFGGDPVFIERIREVVCEAWHE